MLLSVAWFTERQEQDSEEKFSCALSSHSILPLKDALRAGLALEEVFVGVDGDFLWLLVEDEV
jgi:hypothetical protein